MDKQPPSAQDTLQGYFDDLLLGAALGDEEVELAEPVHEATETSGRMDAVASPRQSSAQALASQKLAQQPVEAADVEPRRPVREPLQEHKVKVEKLLQSAQPQVRPQVAADPVVSAERVEPEIATPVVVEPAPELAIVVPEVAVPEARIAEPEAVVVAPVEPVLNEVVDEQIALADDFAWLPNGRPAWAQEGFDALLFSVSGLTLAVPLVALGHIENLTDELTPLFGQADWFMGLLPTNTGKIRTVNTAMFVMPERYDERFTETAKYVISINGLPWGLAVDSVNQPIKLSPEDVNWRTERSKRPWLAGTVKKHMCALLDIPVMGQLLMETDANAGGN